MARQPRILAPGLLYHVIARGNQRQRTFLDDLDYRAYLARLGAYRERYAVHLYAYCLMPNHVHLLVQTSKWPLSKFMQGLQQSYTQRFNRVHRKVGHLFQGRYKAIVCDRDEYLVALVRYIHLNPVRAGLVERPEAYPYSGHCAYLGDSGTGLVDPGPALELLGGRGGYVRFVLAGVDSGHEERYYPSEDPQILGPRSFADRTRKRAGQPPTQCARPRASLEETLTRLARRYAVETQALRGPDRSCAVSRARAAVSFILVRRLGYRVTDVAAVLGRDAATISVIVSRLARRSLDARRPPSAELTDRQASAARPDRSPSCSEVKV